MSATNPIRPGDSVTLQFVTHNATTGADTDADSTPTGVLVRNGSNTAVTVTIADVGTGLYTAAWTIPDSYSAGDEVQLRVTATVNSVTGSAVVWDRSLTAGLDDSVGDLDTAASSYLTVAEFLKRYDWRTIARYCSDTGEALDEADLTTDVNLLALLADASGVLEMAALRGSRYSSAQLSALTGVAKAARDRIIADVAICLVYERRPDIFDHQEPFAYKRAMDQIESLSKGETLFGYEEHKQAGLLSQYRRDRDDVDTIQKGVSYRSRRFFGTRVDREE